MTKNEALRLEPGDVVQIKNGNYGVVFEIRNQRVEAENISVFVAVIGEKSKSHYSHKNIRCVIDGKEAKEVSKRFYSGLKKVVGDYV